MKHENDINFENEKEIRQALQQIKEEGLNMSTNGEWNLVETISGKSKKQGIAKLGTSNWLSVAASLVLVVGLSFPIVSAMTKSKDTVQTRHDGKQTKQSDRKSDEEKVQDTIATDETVTDGTDTKESTPSTTTTTLKSTPDNGGVDEGATAPRPVSGITITATPIGPPATTQNYTVKVKWNKQTPNIQFCTQLAVWQFDSQDSELGHTLYSTGSAECPYGSAQAQFANEKTYTLELTKGNQIRFFISAIDTSRSEGVYASSLDIE